MIRMTLGVILIIAAIINDLAVTLAAASAAHLSFWQYATLNKLGLAVLVWGYNPGLMILSVAAFIGGYLLVQSGRTAGDYRSSAVSDWRTRV